MKKITTSFAVSAALISGMANAETNPFGVVELPTSGYMQVAEAEMACGANMKMDAPKTSDKAATNKKSEATASTKSADTKAEDAKKAAESAPKH